MIASGQITESERNDLHSINYATDVSIVSYTYNLKQNHELKGVKNSTEIFTDKCIKCTKQGCDKYKHKDGNKTKLLYQISQIINM
jgi:hypothetical protein